MSPLSRQREGSALIVRLDDPARRNVLSSAMCAGISDAVAAAEADPDVKCIVVTGAGAAFCAGADLDDLMAASGGDTRAVLAVYQAFLDVANASLPTIAAVNGPAVGAGLNLALACDVRVASRAAVFDTRFLKIGLHPGGGHGWMLQRAVGWAEAARMLLFGQVLDAEAALAAGLVQQVTDPDGLMAAALALAGGTDAVPREVLVRTKRSLRQSAITGHREAFEHETREQAWSLGEPAFQALVARMKAGISKKP